MSTTNQGIISDLSKISYYSKNSCFKIVNAFSLPGKEFSLILKCNYMDKSEIVSANTDFSLSLLKLHEDRFDCSTQRCIGHTDRISETKFSDILDDDLQNAIISVSYDKTLRIWDKRFSDCIASANSPNNKSLFCVDNTGNVIVAGSHESVIMWDLRKMKVLHHFTELHSDDVTCVKFNNPCSSPIEVNPVSKNVGNLLLTTSEDCVCNLLDLKNGEAEDEFIEASYTSEQPLVSCGFVGTTGLAYVITGINTVEILDLETMLVIKEFSKFDREINYAIQAQYIEDKMLFFMGNNLGEAFIYKYDNKANEFEYLDMIFANNNQYENLVVRNAFCTDSQNVVLSTDHGEIHHYKYSKEEKKDTKLNLKKEIQFSSKPAFAAGSNDKEIDEEAKEATNSMKKRKKYKPF